ncbi:SDR family NAD(P)-dependent oxidoreductase [Arundinibacter roseus]|uniref:SDR family oxidoreductase n=1 Tax=Arundinibacter roseus TaxID=2070510 RepID=A0A4R4KJI0_9BACT|nr:SDR family oxidoreductase [Arundinibacter roseus]TDB67036.1 SDR family oxidoreductase [Arundinibacter roseus]
MLKERFDLTSRLALVTGASQGIGRSIALGLAEYGADVIVLYHSGKKNAEKVAKEIKALNQKAYLFQSDLSKNQAPEKLFAKLKKKHLFPDILVINASVQVARPWADMTEKDFSYQVNTNIRATLQLMQLFMPHLLEQQWGRIVTLGSVQESRPHPAMIVYAATKAAVENMVKNVAIQVADKGVTVNNLAPGVIGTPRIEEPVPEIDEEIHQRMTIPAGGIGEPEDCAAVALLLCSEAGRFITGQTIFVDGGMSL